LQAPWLNSIQSFDYCVHETHNSSFSVRYIPKFVMKSIRKPRAKFKALDK